MSAVPGIDAYQEMSRENSEVLIEQNAALVKRIAHHLSGKLPNTVQIEDLIQAGMIGLIEAARNYDASQGAAFETYAGIRIRGAIIDEVRRNGWAPRSVHRKSREAAEAVRTIESKEGREANDNEVAELLGVTLEEYRKIVSEAASHRLLSLDEDEEGSVLQVQAKDDEQSNPYLGVQMEMYRDALLEAVELLPEREQLVMSLYYDEEMNLREIGAVLGVSESRVCQIHGQAIIRLQAKMKSWHRD
ncbi:MAG: RNA polymerase sigma factor FliA [Gammaproteobacteria bacterium]